MALQRPLVRQLLGLLLLGVLLAVLRVSATEVRCSGRLWCTVHSSSDAVVAQAYFHYSPDSGLCVQVAADCLPASNCSFSSVDGCHSVCGEGRSTIGGCGSTKYGCCVDGVTVREEGNCPGESEDAAAGGKGEGGGVHWGLIASGVCGAVLLLGLVAVVGLSTYAYRQRHRNRHRWYIHEVLQMYDGGDSSDSGAASDNSSWDDPENKNLFDRL